MTSDSRDWAALDDGPAGLIADRLLAHDVADYLRFRSMCRTWRRCSADPRSHDGLDRRFHPRLWVLLQERLGRTNSRCFFNSSTGKFIQVDLPELRDHYLLAHTPEGLLVLLQQLPQLGNVRLLNPLTRHIIELPPLTTLLPQEKHHVLFHDNIRYFKAWGSGIAYDDSLVVLCFYSLSLLGVAKPGDESWTLVEFNNRLQTSPLMFAGRFYYFSVDGVMVLKTSPPGPPRIEEAARRHMAVSASSSTSHLVDNAGELMMVHRVSSTEEGEPRWRYAMYRVDLGTRALVRVNSFGGGRALFLGMDCSLSVPVGVFPSGSISSDTIYFKFGLEEWDEVEAYHLSDRSIEPAKFNLDGFMPQPHTLADCLSLSESHSFMISRNLQRKYYLYPFFMASSLTWSA
uniref:Uncharacterized protein n=1 Tax=Avena sativa TaxID=4498 RepID=A0ACD5WQ26_AVESA